MPFNICGFSILKTAQSPKHATCHATPAPGPVNHPNFHCWCCGNTFDSGYQPGVLCPPSFKSEIEKIISKYAANRTSLTPQEFLTFLQQEQDLSPPENPSHEAVTAEK